jgi:hypothetical protein
VIIVAAFEPPAVVAGLDNIAVVGQPVEQRSGHLGVAEHARHSPKASLVVTMTEARS